MSNLQIVVWGKRNMPLHKVGVVDKKSAMVVGRHLHMKFPNNFIELIDQDLGATPIRFHGTAIYTWVPVGHQKRTRLANEIRSQGDAFIYGSIEKPRFISRVGKGDMEGSNGRLIHKSRGKIDFHGLKQSQSRFDK